MSLAAIAEQIGVSEAKPTRSKAKFIKLASIDPAGGFSPFGQFQSNGDKLIRFMGSGRRHEPVGQPECRGLILRAPPTEVPLAWGTASSL
jgi:hypothetical protein